MEAGGYIVHACGCNEATQVASSIAISSWVAGADQGGYIPLKRKGGYAGLLGGG